MSGLPGTGKSAIADALGRARRLPVLSVDPVESALIRAGIAPGGETGLAAYLVVEALADAVLAAGVAVIVDAVNGVDEARAMWRQLAAKHGVPLVVVVCSLSDPALHARRLAARDRGLLIPEPTWAQVEARRAEWTPWPEPGLTLDGADDFERNVASVLAHLDVRADPRSIDAGGAGRV